MLVVKIEMHSAITGKVSEIGRMNIGNVGGTKTRGDYEVQVLRKQIGGHWPDSWTSDSKKVARTGEVKNYPRLSYNVWRLVARALLSAFPEEDPCPY